MGKKGKMKNRIKAIMHVFLVVLVLSMGLCAIDVVANNSWIDKDSEVYKELYGDNAVIGDETYEVDVYFYNGKFAGANILIKLIGALIVLIAEIINGLFEFGDVDLSIDAIIYGRLERNFASGEVLGLDFIPDMKMDIAHFGLETNNPWGIFGATVYYNLRDKFAFVLIPVIFLFYLGRQLINNGQKEREQLKTYCKNIVFYIFVVLAMPYVVDVYIFIRDLVMSITGDGLATILSEISGGKKVVDTSSIFNFCRKAYYSSAGSFTDALLMLGTALAGLFFLWDYIKIAALLAVGFGVFPIVMVWWFFRPKILADWASIMFPALLTPFIDMLFLMLPAFVSVVFQSVFGSSIWLVEFVDELGSLPDTSDFVLAVIILILLWNGRSLRDRVIKLFGFDGMPRANGLGMMMALMMRGGLEGTHGISGGSGAGAGGGSGTAQTAAEAIEAADGQRDIGKTMQKADEEIGIGDEEIDDLFGGGSDTDDFLAEMGDGDGMPDEGAVPDMSDESDVPDVPDIPDVPDERNVSDMPDMSDVPDIPDVKSVARKEDFESGEDSVDGDSVPEGRMSEDGVASGEDAGTAARSGVAAADSETVAGAVPEIKAPPLSAEEKEFARSLSERDRARYANLRNLDALEEKAGSNRRIMEEVGYSRGEYGAEQRNNARISRDLDREQAHYKSLEAKQAEHETKTEDARRALDILDEEKGMLDTSIAKCNTQMDELRKGGKANTAEFREVQSAYSALKERRREVMSAREEAGKAVAGEVDYEKRMSSSRQKIETLRAEKAQSDEKLKAWGAAHQASIENATYSGQIAQRREVERKYAFNSGLGGMKDTVYKDAADFRYKKEVEQIQKRHVDYRNFDSKQYESILTPEEKETFYRERAWRAIRQKNVDVLAKGAGLVGAVAAGYGGSQASMIGAVVAKSAVTKIEGHFEEKRIASNRPTRPVSEQVIEIGQGTVGRNRGTSGEQPGQHTEQRSGQPESVVERNRAGADRESERLRSEHEARKKQAEEMIKKNRSSPDKGMRDVDE